ncbi:hypothetical protein BJX64DRAFT_269591, partial [Aspergillus heterothallicus]
MQSLTFFFLLSSPYAPIIDCHCILAPWIVVGYFSESHSSICSHLLLPTLHIFLTGLNFSCLMHA